MKVYVFDVDETLEISNGPIPLSSLLELREQGHIVGLCGNWGYFCRIVPNWHKIISVIVNLGTPKDWAMAHFRQNVLAEEFVMVGNILGVSGASDDKGAAERAGWRFIKESDFAGGER